MSESLIKIVIKEKAKILNDWKREASDAGSKIHPEQLEKLFQFLLVVFQNQDEKFLLAQFEELLDQYDLVGEKSDLIFFKNLDF